LKRVETDAPRANVSLPVTGMTCAACARTIENTLEDTPGVENFEVSCAIIALVLLGKLLEARARGSLEPPIAARDIGDDTGSSVFLRAA